MKLTAQLSISAGVNEKVSRAGARLLTPDIDFGLDDRLLPIDAVIQISGLGRAKIYNMMRAGQFPKACKPGGCASRWSENEVKAWRDEVLRSREAS